MGLDTIANMFATGAITIVGDPIILGVLIFAFFAIFVLLQNTRLDHKVAILVPASFLSLAFVPILSIVVGLAFGIILYLAFTKLTNR